MDIHLRCLVAAVLALLLGMPPFARADDAADRAALEAAAQAWVKAVNARNVDALATLATEDVVLLDPALPPVSGLDAARGALQQAAGVGRDQWTMVTKEAVISGDVAWRIAALTRKQPNGQPAGRGQSLEIWKRVNGQWKMHRQMSSGLLAQPTLLRPPPSGPVLDAPRN